MNPSRLAWVAGLILLLVFAALYLYTLDDGLRPGELQGGDLITHQYAQVQGRFSNAPGYPLYTMGGWLWFHTGRLLLGPDHNPIPILSSYSTLWALIALGLLYALGLLVTTDEDAPAGNWPLALVVTAFFGLTYFFWYYAVTTEQYTSSVAWTLAVVLLAFRWASTTATRWLPAGPRAADGGRARPPDHRAGDPAAVAVVRAQRRTGTAAPRPARRRHGAARPAAPPFLRLRVRPGRAASGMARRGPVGEHVAMVPELHLDEPGSR